MRLFVVTTLVFLFCCWNYVMDVCQLLLLNCSYWPVICLNIECLRVFVVVYKPFTVNVVFV